jgi:hypothetical protein
MVQGDFFFEKMLQSHHFLRAKKVLNPHFLDNRVHGGRQNIAGFQENFSFPSDL